MASELEVGGLKVGSSSDPTLKLHNTTGSTNDTAAVVFGVSTGTADGPRIESKRQSDGTIDLNLFTAGATSQTNASAAIVIDGGTNNVGIGTPTPTVGNLQIRDDSVSILALTRTTASTSSDIGMVRFGNTNVDSNLANIVAYHDGANDSAKLVFQTQATGGATADRLTIASDGLCTFSAGIKAEKGILSGTVLIADDAVTTITPPRKGGFLKLLVDSATAEAGEYPQNIYSGEVFFDCGTSLGIVKCDLSSSLATQLDVSVSNVTGTTGTDGNVTIAVQSGVIKIENRSNGEKRFNYFLYC